MSPELDRHRREAFWQHPRRRRWRSGAGRLLLSGVLLVLCFSLAGRTLEVMYAKREVARLKADIAVYEMKRQTLLAHIEMLQDDAYIERVARDELGLVKPGEIQYFTVRSNQAP
ncbi:MAG: septum formation initiator family protein [Bacillota bacterium]